MADQVVDSAGGQADVQQVPSSAQPAPIGWRAPRPARVPLGWLAPEQGEFLLANRAEVGPPEDRRARVREAREAVAARPVWGDRAGLVSPLPAELGDHAARLGATPVGTAMRAEGWDIAMVDLDEIVAFQPNVFTDTTSDRVAAQPRQPGIHRRADPAHQQHRAGFRPVRRAQPRLHHHLPEPEPQGRG